MNINLIRKRVILFLLSIILSGSVIANPTGGVVTSGNATITQTGGNTVIQQNSQKTIINWQSFNIGSHEKTHFQQPQGGVALNRINANQGPSQIYGQLTATGKIILVNQAGIFFGPGSYINVGGIIATTSNISDQNFLAGKLIFDQPSPFNASVINKGTIIAAQNGLIALIGNSVSNDGLIQVRTGNVILASGNKFTVDLYGDQLINFTVDEGTTSVGKDEQGNSMNSAVNNSGTIIADGGTILMTAKAASGVVDNAINMSGVAQARSVDNSQGEIILSSDAPAAVLVSGLLDASGKTANQQGGTIKILGSQIHLAKTARVDASGDLGGGEILVGGNYQGKGPEQNALNTSVDAGVILNANALTFGNAGKVIVWSNQNTLFHGTITAQGGMNGGNGGFVETSGHYLDVSQGSINLLAAKGTTGTWLLDPTDLTISTSSSSNVSQSGNVFTGDANSTTSILNVNTLTTALATANIIVQTQAGGTGLGSGDIIVANDISWNASTSLTLSAYRNIVLNANITNATGSSISVNLQSDNTGTGTGTVSGTGVVTTAASGNINIYYNPIDYTSPTDYSANASGGTLKAFMLINSLGTDTDGLTDKTLGALSNSANSSLWSNNYALGRDIDASATSTWNGGSGFHPIGNAFPNFTGSFDGQYHIIDNLYINLSTSLNGNTGLFGDVNGGGFIRNIGITNASVATSVTQLFGSVNIGILAGAIYSGSISNAYTTGTVTNTSGAVRAGGLVGYSGAATDHSYSTATVNVSYASDLFANIGGLIGFNTSGSSISNSYSTGPVTLNLTAGFHSTAIQLGGFVGANHGTITNSFTSSNVQASGSNNTNLLIGAFIGENILGTITNSLAIGGINASIGVVSAFGQNDNVMSGNYVDTGTTGNGVVTTGITAGCFSGGSCPNGGTANLSSQATYSGWDFTSTWGIIEGESYPYLQYYYSTTPRAISGIATTSSIPSNTEVVLSSGGTTFATTRSFANGMYYFLVPQNTISDSTSLLIYLTGSATKANTVTITPTGNGSLLNVALTGGTLQLGDNNTHTITNTILQQALGSLGTTDALYSATSSSLTLGAGSNLSVILTSTPTTTYTIQSLTDTGNSSLNFLGTTSIATSSINTGGSQTYGGIINLLQSTTLTANNSSMISFNNTNTLSGAYDLVINSNTISLNGLINGLTSLNLTGNNIALNTTGITTTGAQNYNGSVTLGSNVVLSGSQMSFGSITGNSHILALQGDSSSNSFTFSGTSSGLSSFTIDGGSAGTDTINFNGSSPSLAVTISSVGSNHGLNGATNYGGLLFDDIDVINGNLVTSNSLTGANVTSSWTSSGINSGTYNIGSSSLTFSNFQQLISGSANTTFFIPLGSSFSSIQGGSGINTIDYSGFTSDVTVDLTSLTATNIGSFSNIQVFVGGSGNNSLVQTAGGNTWNITGSNSGTIGTTSFSAFSNLTGGNNDTFVLSNGANIAGNLVSSGNGTLNVSAVSSPTINLATNTSTGIGGTFSGITQFVGSDAVNGASNSTLIGTNSATTWLISGVNSGTVGSSTFNSFGNIVGGTGGSNQFTFATNSSLSNIDGGNSTYVNSITIGDAVVLNLSSLDSGRVNLSNNSPVTNFSRIQMITSSGATGSINIPTNKTYTIKYYNAPLNTYGEIGDPFYFNNFSINNPPAPQVQTPPVNIANIMVSANPTSDDSMDNTTSSNDSSSDTSAANGGSSTSVTESVTQDVALSDMETQQQSITYGCFSAQ